MKHLYRSFDVDDFAVIYDIGEGHEGKEERQETNRHPPADRLQGLERGGDIEGAALADDHIPAKAGTQSIVNK